MTTTVERYGTTIQCWPGGASFEYRGDIHGPAEQRELRKGYDRSAEWGLGTEDEWRLIRIAELANIYAERDILCCDSALVDDLIKAAGETRGDISDAFSIDSIENMYPNPDSWDAQTCRDWLEERGIDLPDVPTIICPDCEDVIDPDADFQCSTCKGTAEVPDPDADDDDSKYGYLTELRDAVRDNDPEPAEVFEWWRVSSWLCAKLRDIGEVVIDNGYGHWWGRTCTGQGLIMDGTLQRIAAQHVDR